jgi:hypothetical protein
MSNGDVIYFVFGIATGFVLLWAMARIVLTERRAARVMDRKGRPQRL